MKTLPRHTKRFKGFTIGLDLHQAFIQVVVLDKHGNDVEGKRIAFKKDALEKLFMEWKGKGEVQVAFEACGCFYWVFEIASKLLGRERVHAAHAARIQPIANSMEKNDHNDAWWLAYMLHEGRLPEAYVAEGALLELKLAARELRYLTDTRSDLVRRVRSSLAQLGQKLSKGWHTSAVKRTAAQAVIEAVAGVRGEALRDLCRQIDAFSALIAKWKKKVVELGEAFPEIHAMSAEIPGVKAQLAGLIHGELGSAKRFRSAKAYAKATGLTPGSRDSGGKSQAVGITRHGSRHVRWALTRAIVSCMRCRKGVGAQVKAWVQRQVSRQRPKRKAMVAAARKLAEGIWRLTMRGEAFDLKRAFPV